MKNTVKGSYRAPANEQLNKNVYLQVTRINIYKEIQSLINITNVEIQQVKHNGDKSKKLVKDKKKEKKKVKTKEIILQHWKQVINDHH